MITRSRRLHRSRPPITHATTSCQWGRLGRLTRFAMSPGTGSSETSYTGYSQTYGFDANNNRTASTELRTTPQGSLNTLQGWTLQSSSNRLNQRSELSTLDGAIQTSRTDRYTLDAAGNQSDDGWQRFQYDALNRLGRSIGTSHSVLYLHNALGQRTFKSGPKPESLNTPVGSLSEWIGQWVPWAKGAAIANNLQRQGTAFMYDEAGQLLGEYVHDGSNPNSQGGEYIWLPRPDGGSELVGYVKSQGSQTQRYAVHSDHLGTPRRISNESGQPVWQWAYSAYGDNAAQVLAAAPPGFEFNPRFPGQYFDSESGKHYSYFRTYDPKTGRYTSADPIGLAGGWNRFGYVEGNPVSFTDPSGLQANRPQWWNDMWAPMTDTKNCATGECAAGTLPARPPTKMSPEACFATCFTAKTGGGLLIGGGVGKLATMVGPTTGAIVNGFMNSEMSILGSELMGIEYCYKKCDFKHREICEDDQLSNVLAP